MGKLSDKEHRDDLEDDPDAEYIAEIEREIASGTELEGWERIPGRVSKNLTITYAIRMSPAEHKEFEQAAVARGITLAELMRSATRAAIRGEIDADAAATLSKARATAQELAETLNRL
jgi:hypothetical protein